MMVVEAGTGEWLVVATVDGPVVLPRIDFAQCQIVKGELRARVSAASSDEAKQKAETLFRRATWSLLLSSRRQYDFKVSRVKSLAEKGSQTIYVTDTLRVRLTPEDTATAVELYELLRTIRPAQRRLEMGLSDLQCAMSDGTPFAFVHLHRCLEQIKEFFGGWPAMRADLNLSEGYLRYVTTRRSGPEFGTAHAPVKRGPRTRITRKEIREGTSRAVEVLKRFLYFLADRPVGELR
jgi:hypothetical protein